MIGPRPKRQIGILCAPRTWNVFEAVISPLINRIVLTKNLVAFTASIQALATVSKPDRSPLCATAKAGLQHNRAPSIVQET
jgi:hypothetical protein